MSAVLELSGVTMRFGGLTAVADLDLAVPRGAITGLIGPNGAGKTTVFNMITGFYKPTTGNIHFNGRNITGTAPHRICKAGIARTFQNIRLFGTASALQNVMVGGQVNNRTPWWTPVFLLNLGRERTLRARALELLDMLGLADVAACPPGRCLMGPNAGWKSPEPWPPTRRFCCWMSRLPG